MKTRERVSAGGVAFKTANDATEVVLIKTSSEGRWQLPKGHLDPGETSEQAALREVREEGGIDCELIAEIEKVDYWYVDRWGSEPVRTHKYVHFYLMKYVGGSTDDHDDEVTEARWFDLKAAIESLAFPAEKAVVKKAAEMIA